MRTPRLLMYGVTVLLALFAFATVVLHGSLVFALGLEMGYGLGVAVLALAVLIRDGKRRR